MIGGTRTFLGNGPRKITAFGYVKVEFIKKKHTNNNEVTLPLF